MATAALYLGVPSATFVLWLVHTWWWWRRPERRNPFTVLLFAAAPAAALVTFIRFGSVQDRPPNDPLPPGDHGDLRLRLLIVGVELVFSWLVVLCLELMLGPIRSRRRRRDRTHNPRPTGDQH